MVLNLLGMLVVAMFASGALAAGWKNFDLLGGVVIALITAVGVGTLRDLLLDRHTCFCVEAASHLTVFLVIATMTLDYASTVSPTFVALAVSEQDYCISERQSKRLSRHKPVIHELNGTF